jgi:tetratricopeptide (TPR) repeat protein
MDPGTLFILESILAYLISMAAGLSTSTIGEKAQRRLKRDLETISQKIQDQNQSRSFEESLELIPIDAAKLRHRLKDAFIDGPVTNLCVDEQFQKGITDYFLEKDPKARNALEDKLKADIVAAFLDAGATKEQAGNNGDLFFQVIQRRVFEDQALSNFLLHGQVRHVNEQLYQQGKKLDTILRYERSGVRLPLQHPRQVEHFTGREEELEKLLKDLQPGKTVTLCGTGGIGKSALASKAVWLLAPADKPPEKFPDGIIYHDFYANPKAEQALEHVALSFNEKPEPTPIEAARRVLSGRKVLIVLDGAENADDLPRVLSVTDSCGVLVTSQDHSDAAAEWLDIDPLPEPEAMRLLQDWYPSVVIDDEIGQRICELLGFLPLAVRLAGRYMRQTGERPADYLDWLQDSPLDALDLGQSRDESVLILIKRSIAKLSESSLKALYVTGLLELAPFRGEVVAGALDIQLAAARHLLGELVSFGLLVKQNDHQDYAVTHRLIYTYTKHKSLPMPEAARRLADYYGNFARTQEKKGKKGYARLNDHRAHIMQVLTVCEHQQLWQPLIGLVWAIENFMDLQGFRSDQITSLEKGLGAAKKIDDKLTESAFLGYLGIAYRVLGRVEKAIKYHERALDIARETGDQRNEGNQLGNIGIAYRALGQVEKAIEYYVQSLAIHREIGNHQGEGNSLGNIGNAYRDLGQAEKAIEYHKQALAIHRKIGYRQGEGNHLCNLGDAYRDLGQVEKAIEYHEQALAIHREIGYRRGESRSLGNLWIAYRDLGQVEKAIVVGKRKNKKNRRDCSKDFHPLHGDLKPRKYQ